MDILNGFNKAISYIEENLENDIVINDVADIACCSNFHFMRMFSALTGIGVYEYIKKRRMTKAAEELQTTDIKIVDLALKYGYDSPTAFNRAFNSIHNVSPSVARKDGVQLNSYLPISFNLTITGGKKMEYYIEEINTFRAVGYKRTYNFKTGENFKLIPLFWQDIMTDGRFNALLPLNTIAPLGTLGICTNLRDNEFDYFIAVASDCDTTDDLEELTIEKQTYAVFTCNMSEIQDTTKRILAEWLPNSEYTHVENAAELEIYPDAETCKICIPIKK